MAGDGPGVGEVGGQIQSGTAGSSAAGTDQGGTVSNGGNCPGSGCGGAPADPAPGGSVGTGGLDVAGAAGAEDECSMVGVGILWDAIRRGAVGLGECTVEDPPPTGAMVTRSLGAIAFDEDGRVVDNTGLMGAEKEAWLDALGGKRWPCFAGTTIGYRCTGVHG